MRDTDSDSDATWNCRQIADDLCESLGQLVELRGTDAPAIKKRLTDLRAALADRDVELLCLDPTGSSGDARSLRELSAEYVRRAEAGGAGDERLHRLLDVITDVRHRPSETDGQRVDRDDIQGAVSQIWSLLADDHPSILLLLHPDELTADDRRMLDHLVARHFADGLGAIVPELASDRRLGCSLVFAGRSAPDFAVDAPRRTTLDLTIQSRQAIRDQLADETVVDRLVASTGGDPDRLGELLDALPDDGEHFWQFRVRGLDPEARQVLELLAVAGHPLPAASLRRIYRGWTDRRLDPSQIRTLCEAGFLRRQLEEGTMRLELADVELRHGLVEAMEADRRSDCHGAIAETCADGQMRWLDDGFLAEHFLAAGDIARGFEHGMRAAERRHARHDLQEARRLFERLLDCQRPDGRQERDDEIRAYLVDILGDLGEIGEALDQIEVLEQRLEADDPARWRARIQKGRLLTQRGDYAAAEAVLGELADRFDPVNRPAYWATVLQAKADAHYTRGDQQTAGELARRVCETIDEEPDRPGRLARTLIAARNILGRIAIYRGDEEEAGEAFETNATLARRWGWHREVTRAELNLAVLDLQADRFAEAAEAIEALLDKTPAPTTKRRAYLLVNLGMARQKTGRLDDALNAYRDGFRTARRAEDDVTIGIAAHNLATLLQDLGAYDRVVDLVDWLRGQQLDEQHHLIAGRLPGMLLSSALVDRGDYAEALETLESMTDGDETLPGEFARPKVELRAARAHIELDQLDVAADLLDDLDAEAVEADPELEGLQKLGYALLANRHANWRRAAQFARAAAEPLRQAGVFQNALYATVARARALAELGRDGEAEALVERRMADFLERADDVPAGFESHFHAIPVHRRFVDLYRELTGQLPDDLPRPAEPGHRAETEQTSIEMAPEAEPVRRSGKFPNIVGHSPQLREVLQRLDQVADSDSTVLIQGESGTGKELVAEALHRESGRSRRDGPFVKVNCGAFVDNLLLSELFGHEEGAFTGAVEQKEGCFERADGGTIFLDEIGEVSPKAQVALLRVLQEGEFEPVGGTETRRVDVRVVCATNRNLSEMVEEGSFRLDLYYRLKGVLLELPPLRERRGDIPALLRHFADRATDGQAPVFSRDVLEFLASYRWPGNIRELQHLVESLLLFADRDRVEMSHLREFRDFFPDDEVDERPPEIDYDPMPFPAETEPAGQTESTGDESSSEPADRADRADRADTAASPPAEPQEEPEDRLAEDIVGGGRNLQEIQRDVQHRAIRRALQETGGNITRAAELLDMSRPRVSQIVNGDDDLRAFKEQLVA